MQDRYSGDVGDFSKFGLLRHIAATGLVVGINWYLVENEIKTGDGKHIGFLSDSRFDGCDDELRDALRCAVANERRVSMLEEQELIKNAIYFSSRLLPPATKKFSRDDWHKRAMKRLSDADIIFLDPDNGIITKSTSPKSAKSVKFVLHDEICDYYMAGHSLVIYNHRSRQTEPEYLRRFDWMIDEPRLKTAHRLGLKFVRGTVRDYIFLIQPKHQPLVLSAVETILNSAWNKHFAKISF
ncbi:MAG: hypothetical protein FWC60_06260 [Firmicutes bacterium]|nr:hypothetical protein [Bacillota bacterium]